MLSFLKRNKYLVLSSIIVVTIFILFNLIFYKAYINFYYSMLSLINGLITYFKGIFLFDRNVDCLYFYNFSKLYLDKISIPITSNSDYFGYYFSGIFFQYWNLDYFTSSINNIILIFNFINILLLIIILFFTLRIVFDGSFFSEKDKNKVGFTRFLKKLFKFQNKYLYQVKCFFNNLINTFNKYYLFKALLFFFLFYFNVISLFLVFLSYLFDICISFNVLDFYYLIYSGFYLLYPTFSKVSIFIWLIVVYFIVRFYFKIRAKNKLYHLDSLNERFVESLGVSVFIDGVSGSGKTTFSTLISFYKEEIFRKLARKKIDKYMSYFPKFNFQLFNKYLDYLILNRVIKNRIQLKKYIKNKYDHFLNLIDFGYKDINKLSKASIRFYLFDYNLKFKLYHYNGLKIIHLFDILANYSECYYVYSRNCLGIISNNPMQTSLVSSSEDYFVSFNDFWNEIDNKNIVNKVSSGVIDYDSMRLGKTFSNDYPIIDSLVINIDEADKERGNQFSWRGIDKNDLNPNLLNDRFNWFINTCRHGNLIDNDVFVSIILTCQREGDITSGLIESCESIIDIDRNSKKYKNTYYKYSIFSRLIASFFVEKLSIYCYKYLKTRNYYSFIYYILFSLKSYLSNYLDFIDNRYGYDLINLNIRDSKSKENLIAKNFFIIYKRIYADNFKSNGLASIYENKAMLSTSTFVDERKFNNLTQSIEDLRYQNSYFFKSIDSELSNKVIDHKNDIGGF